MSKARLTLPNVASATRGRSALAVAGGLLIVVVVWLAMTGRRPEAPATTTASGSAIAEPKAPVPSRPTATPAQGDVLIDSRPAGASIWVGNRDSGLRTPARVRTDTAGLDRMTLRLPGYEEAAVPVTVGDTVTSARSVTLTRERTRRALRLVATGSYPFDVVVGGRVVSPRRIEHSVMFTEGQAVRLRAAEYFLDVPVAVGSSAVTEVRAAGLGDIEVRSARETCRVTIDGRTLDYPPVKQRLAAGVHIIALADCPGSARTRTNVRAGIREVVILR